jgi:predicted nuclease with TOPRIM domain
MNIKRYTPLNCGFYPFAHVVECEVGQFVSYNDFNSLNTKYQELNTNFDKLQKEKEYLEDYTDHLVSFSKLPCLPKDLENLREANFSFSTENEKIKKELQMCSTGWERALDANDSLYNENIELELENTKLKNDIIAWKNKWECAVEMAAIAENKIKHISNYLNN